MYETHKTMKVYIVGLLGYIIAMITQQDPEG